MFELDYLDEQDAVAELSGKPSFKGYILALFVTRGDKILTVLQPATAMAENRIKKGTSQRLAEFKTAMGALPEARRGLPIDVILTKHVPALGRRASSQLERATSFYPDPADWHVDEARTLQLQAKTWALFRMALRLESTELNAPKPKTLSLLTEPTWQAITQLDKPADADDWRRYQQADLALIRTADSEEAS